MEEFIKRPKAFVLVALSTLCMPFFSYSYKISSYSFSSYIFIKQILTNNFEFSTDTILKLLLILMYGLILVHLVLLLFTAYCQRGSKVEIVLDVLSLGLSVLFLVWALMNDTNSASITILGQNISHTLKISSGFYVLIGANIGQLVINFIKGTDTQLIEQPVTSEPISDPAVITSDGTTTYTMSEMNMNAQEANINGVIIGKTGPYATAEIPIHPDEQLAIGRDPEICNLVINSVTISKIHCYIQIRPETGNYMIMDVSLNGTYLQDGSRLPKGSYIELKPDVNIYLGTIDNTFYLSPYRTVN